MIENDSYNDGFNKSLEATITDIPIYGKLHSACTTNGKQFVLFDEKNTYIVKINPLTHKVIENTYIKYVANNEKLDLYFAVKYKKELDNVYNNIMHLDVQATVKDFKLSLLPLITNNNSSNPKVYVGLNNSRIGFF